MKKKKIAFIGTNDYPIPAIYGGAIQTLVTALINENEKSNLIDIEVFTVFSDKLETYIKQYNNTKFHLIKHDSITRIHLFLIRVLRKITHNFFSFSSVYMMRIIRILKMNTYDFIIFETTDKEIVQLPNEIKNKSRILYHVHADYLNESVDRIDVVVSNTDYFIAVSDFIKERIEGLSSINRKKIITLSNAIDISNSDTLVEIQSKRNCIRKEYGLKETDNVLMFCGRLSQEKGCLQLIRSVIGIKDCKLIIVGGNNFSSDKVTDYVKQLYKESENAVDQILFTGYVPHEEVKNYMYAADIGVVPSVCNESCSLTLIEYRAVGLPTIATNIGGIPEYCNSDTTVLVDYDNNFETNMRRTIIELINDRERLQNMKKYATQNLEEFGYSKYYERFCCLLGKVE